MATGGRRFPRPELPVACTLDAGAGAERVRRWKVLARKSPSRAQRGGNQLEVRWELDPDDAIELSALAARRERVLLVPLMGRDSRGRRQHPDGHRRATQAGRHCGNRGPLSGELTTPIRQPGGRPRNVTTSGPCPDFRSISSRWRSRADADASAESRAERRPGVLGALATEARCGPGSRARKSGSVLLDRPAAVPGAGEGLAGRATGEGPLGGNAARFCGGVE